MSRRPKLLRISLGILFGISAAILLVAAADLAAQAEGSRSETAVAVPPEEAAGAETSPWRRPNPENTVYFELPSGRVVVELAPEFAPRHVANIKRLVREGRFDGGGVVRSQDNYVAQWATRPIPDGVATPEVIPEGLPSEFERPSAGLPWTPLGGHDAYAPETGFALGMPVARDPTSGRAWIVHCYGVVAVARDEAPDTGNGSQLYAVTGHAPRHLDRNLTVVGRVIDGMEHLSTLPRGTGDLGFYETDAEIVPLRARVAADVPVSERTGIEILRTDSREFVEFVASRRTRKETFFVHEVNAVDVCNVRVPVR